MLFILRNPMYQYQKKLPYPFPYRLVYLIRLLALLYKVLSSACFLSDCYHRQYKKRSTCALSFILMWQIFPKDIYKNCYVPVAGFGYLALGLYEKLVFSRLLMKKKSGLALRPGFQFLSWKNCTIFYFPDFRRRIFKKIEI